MFLGGWNAIETRATTQHEMRRANEEGFCVSVCVCVVVHTMGQED